MQEVLKTIVTGHVRITDTKTGEVLCDDHNAIHPRNMAIAIARGLANSPNFQIYKLKLGNQGTYIDGTQQIIFRPPNTTDGAANLYNPTYYEVVDEENTAVGAGNSVVYTLIPTTTNTRVIITCVISSNEAINNPTDGGDGDPSLDPEGAFFFDELGLFTAGTGVIDATTGNQTDELLLTHIIFSPIEHTGNREITIVYTLTISVS